MEWSGRLFERSAKPLAGFLTPVVAELGRSERRVAAETGWLKQGRHSAGVSHQYCGPAGKQASCQVSVELVVGDGWIAAAIGGRLYLPESWTKDRERCARAGVPEQTGFATKPVIALQLVREALADGVAPAPVPGEPAYGDNAGFRAGLRESDLEFFLQAGAARHKGWSFEAPTELKQVRRHPAADAPPPQTLMEIAAAIPAGQWQPAHWKRAGGERDATGLV